MIRWAAFLAKLKDDGVTLDECEGEAITPDGERTTTRFLARYVEGKYLWCEVGFESLDDPVPRREQRRIANRLRLPPERYHFEES